MCARPYGPRRDWICRLMLDPSSKIPRVMHVRLRGLAIQIWCYPGFCTKSARQCDNSDPLARLLITRQMALSPKCKRVIAAQHGMCRSLLRVPFFLWRNCWVGWNSLMCMLHVSFDLLLFPGWFDCGHVSPLFCAAVLRGDTSGMSGVGGAMVLLDNDGEHDLVMI